MIEREDTPLSGLIVLRPRIFVDDRGAFHESYNHRAFEAIIGQQVSFVQDNESRSMKGVLRGLHFQTGPHAQGKLVRVIRGAVLDACVDIRPQSPTYGRHFTKCLDGATKEMLWVPPGFAHGFLALEDDTIFAYKCTTYYHPSAERTLAWNDPEVAIDWGTSTPTISPKDANGLGFHELHTPLIS